MDESLEDKAIDATIVGVKAALSLTAKGGVLAALLDYLPTTWQRRTNKILNLIQEDLERMRAHFPRYDVPPENYTQLVFSGAKIYP